MSQSQLTMLSKFVIFSILVGVVGSVLVVVGLALPLLGCKRYVLVEP